MKKNKLTNSYSAKPIKDVEIEIGDTKDSSKFYPQVKLMKWDNEVNFSVRLKTEIVQSPKLKKDIISTDNIKFYELPDSIETPEGAYEFEIEKKEKGNSNKVEFTIQTKGLEFLPQPDLSKMKGFENDYQPENVKGSIAVYHENCPKNYIGGKVYKTGKVCHIYRPKIIDDVGNWTWGELNIDKPNGLLTVTIPEDFWEIATYPIHHAAGLTFGLTTVGASEYKYGYGDGISGSEYTSGGAGDVSKLTCHIGYTTGFNVKPLLIDGALADFITNGVGGATNVSSGARDWHDIPYTTEPSITATDYYICLISDALWYSDYDYNAGVNNLPNVTNSYSSPYEDSSGWIAEDGGGRIHSFYATFAPPGNTTNFFFMW